MFKINHSIPAILLLIAVPFFYSCRKGPGPGGKATISGKIFEYKYNNEFTNLQGSYFKGDHDVFLQYDGDNTYSEKTSTHYDGTFEFEYLLPGDYTVYTYSKDSSLTTPGSIAIIREVEIEKKETVDLGTIEVYED